MSAFMIVFARISDPETYLREYIEPATELAARYGCEIRAADGVAERVEGAVPDGTVIVMEFPDRGRLGEFYHSSEYGHLRDRRHQLGESDVVLVEGVPAGETP